ncbi:MULTISPECIES: CotH kinase family protein [unclassified Oceanispirochaeta]|uniref:CotH kinase family protein n=1 Tax=unclassified Oceanispirochaeta TaxID=2635722 RepID=UPI000E099DC5|nr:MULTISPECIES: CotH kinase family protein [unclassified Oceanispirochaeta]MBF9017777.1 CotH kinase family protein [Oceanispirochaeta sp. M2]NPD74341.1 hypothetical protein [Oceanispirochaeta sp. M1]RDG29821.1 hypothetical protein DV872_19760 [Oceanispirochaeta sp. M1]
MGHKLPDKIIILFLTLLIGSLLGGCGEFVGILDSHNPDTGLSEFRLYLSDDQFNTLQDSVSLDIYAHCRYESNEGEGRGEMRIRGFTSRMLPKKSFTLRREVNGEEIKIALDAGGAPWISYSLIMYAYSLAGLPYLELSPISLFMNDEYLGYYNQLPLYDESVDDYFGEKGELYKIRAFDLGRDVPAESMSEKKYPHDDNFSSLNRYLVNAAHMSTEDWVDWAEANVDLEDLAAYMVIRDYFGMADTYETNFYVYAGDKYRILPWDNDHYYQYTPVGGNNILTTRMLESEEFQDIYRDLFNRYFLQAGDNNIIDQLEGYSESLYSLLGAAVDVEPFFYLTSDAFEAEKQSIEVFFNTRTSDILSDPYWADFFTDPDDASR